MSIVVIYSFNGTFKGNAEYQPLLQACVPQVCGLSQTFSPMRPALAIAVLAIAATGSAFATGSLSFEGGGYVLDFEVGQQAHPVLAGLSFAAPGASSHSILRPPQLVVVAFDTKERFLFVRYKNPGDSTLPPDFELSVRGSEGILKLPNRSVTGRFNWDM